MAEMDEKLTLTPRETIMLRDIGVCRTRILKKIEQDPRSTRVKAWKARLEDYDRAEQRIAVAAQVRLLKDSTKFRPVDSSTRH